jgi:CRP-like cAMP-binding protein
MRHVVTLPPGAIVGEIALFGESGATRNATVKALSTDHVELLVLDRTSFHDLEPSTLHIIREVARYNSACTKAPGERTPDDVAVLMDRTSHLKSLASMHSSVQYVSRSRCTYDLGEVH